MPETMNFFKHVYMDDTDAYLELAIHLWQEEQQGGPYLWDEKKLPIKKGELKGAMEVFMWDFKRNNHPDLEYYAIAYMLTGRFQPKGTTKEKARKEMQDNVNYLCSEGLICNVVVH